MFRFAYIQIDISSKIHSHQGFLALIFTLESKLSFEYLCRNDAQAEAMRAMIFGEVDSSDSPTTKESGKASFVLLFFVIISLLMKMLKLMSCVALT